MVAIPMPPALRDETARIALERASRTEPTRRLEVSIEERCGDALVAAFLRCANAWFTGK